MSDFVQACGLILLCVAAGLWFGPVASVAAAGMSLLLVGEAIDR